METRIHHFQGWSPRVYILLSPDPPFQKVPLFNMATLKPKLAGQQASLGVVSGHVHILESSAT